MTSSVPTEQTYTLYRRGLELLEDGDFVDATEPLAEAAHEFGRYSNTRILIDDPGLARESVSGRFSSSDPERFARAIAVAFDARVSEEAGALHISR